MARVLFALLLVPLVMFAPACAGPVDRTSKAAVERDLRTFFRAYLGRPLSGKEANDAASEYLALFGSGTCDAPCREDLDAHLRNAREAFGDGPETPQARVWRQSYVTHAAFAVPPTGPTWMRLLQEPDPIVLRHPLTKRTMTEADIEALADLSRFVETGGAPKHHPLNKEEFARFEADVAKLAGPGSRRMPMKAVLAAELFAGLQAEWSRLSPSDRELLRDYVGGASASIPEALFARVLHISPEDARQLRSAEALDAQFAGFYSNLDQMRQDMYGALGEYGTLSALMAATP